MSAFIYTLTYFTRETYICDIYEPWKVESRASQVGKLMDPRKRTPHTDSSSNVRLRMTPPESVPYTPLQPDSERGLDSTLTSRMTFPGRNLAFFFFIPDIISHLSLLICHLTYIGVHVHLYKIWYFLLLKYKRGSAVEAGGVGSGVNYLTFLVHKRPKLYKSQMFVLYLIHEFSLMINDPQCGGLQVRLIPGGNQTNWTWKQLKVAFINKNYVAWLTLGIEDLVILIQ